MRGAYQDHDLFDALDDGDNRKTVIKKAKQLAKRSIFPDQKKVEIELGSYSVFETLLSSFCEAATDRAQHINSPEHEVSLGWKSQLVLKMLGDHAPTESNPPSGERWSEYQCLRRVKLPPAEPEAYYG